jgi:ectoine hydroxylase-related dioxygenase (phytanoyl-CoA dioxygenase family)
VPGVLELCRAPRALALARAMLGSEDVSVFTSRVLCKLPGGREIPWHQDSLYWPLVPPGGAPDGAHEGTYPVVASLWLSFDDLSEDMGVMEVLPFSAAPATRNRSATELVVDSGGSTDAYDNFNLQIDVARLGAAASAGGCGVGVGVGGGRRVIVARGEAEWHSAFVVHRSDANASQRRRLAWIVRYVPTGTAVAAGRRGAFGADFPLVPICGRGADCAREPCRPSLERYAPCFGAAAAVRK